MAKRKFPYTSHPLNKYALVVPLESHIHVSDFEHDKILFIQGKEKNQSDRLEALLEVENLQILYSKVTETKHKFKTIVDAIALLYDKGMKLGADIIMRGEKHVYPDGKELVFFRGWGREEVMVYEETLKNKVVPLYERLKDDDSRIRRCLTWFNIGLSEYDDVDKFLAYWISLEAITPLNSIRDDEAMSKGPVERAIQELRNIRDNNLRSQIIQKVKNVVKYKSIPEAMTDEIHRIVDKTQIASILSLLNEVSLGKLLRVLAHDRAQIAHGERREIQDLEKKTLFLHDLVYAILKHSLLETL